MLTLTMLPARQGDCLWIDYLAGGATQNLVIDGGPEHSNVLAGEVARRIAAAPDGKLHIDLIVVTHIDNDHIGGVLELLKAPPAGLSIGEIWFNGYDQIAALDVLGTDQGDRLSAVLERMRPKWNSTFGGAAVMIPDHGALPRIERNGGEITLTLFGPSRAALAKLAREWDAPTIAGITETVVEEPDDLLGRDDPWPPDYDALLREPFKADTGAPNGSSIAFLLSHGSTRILFAADAPAAELVPAILRLLGESGEGDRLRLEACKLAHHGSMKSTSKALLDLLRCQRWLISSNGSYFGHPDPAAIARVLEYGGPNPELIFNSRREFALRWTAADVPAHPPFTARLPSREGDPVVLQF